MSRTDMFRRQHDAAELMVGEILEMLLADNAVERAYELTLKLAKLTGTLRIHFAQEDLSLYPEMLRSTDLTAAEVAGQFKEEMGGLGAAFEAYSGRWSSSKQISLNFSSFAAETRAVFATLAERIARENSELYPLADRLQWTVPTAA